MITKFRKNKGCPPNGPRHDGSGRGTGNGGSRRGR